MGNILELDHVTEKTTEQGTAGDDSIRFAASGMKGWRVTMEDAHSCSPTIPVLTPNGDHTIELEDHSLYAVFDGHGGNLTSTYAGKHFLRIFAERTELRKYVMLPKDGNKGRSDVTGIDLLRNALKGTFCDLDTELFRIQLEKNEQLRREEQKEAESKDDRNNGSGNSFLSSGGMDEKVKRKIERSGSTCVVVLLTPTHIICANAGDSRALLRRDNRSLPLSFDHKPSNLPEQERIGAAGGFVKAKRVDGDLAVSRGLGDFSFKSLTELSPHKQKVIFAPDILVYPRDKAHDEFILLACDGVWDVANNEQCGDLVQQVFDEGETDLGLVVEEVLDSCLEKNSRDNMTMILVCLPGIRMVAEADKQNAVEARRAVRHSRLLEAQAKAAAQTAADNMSVALGMSPKAVNMTVHTTVGTGKDLNGTNPASTPSKSQQQQSSTGMDQGRSK